MKPFFIVWSGQAFSLLGSQLVQFGIVWWLTKTTGSATLLALATLAALLPQIIIGPFAGALVDRWSRRKVMIAADTGVALATLLLAVLFWLRAAAVWNIYLLLLIRAIGAAFHWPAMQASTTLMVPEKHLGRVAGLNQTLAGLAGILIPPLGALAIEALPLEGVLAIDVGTAIPAILTLFFVDIPQPVRTQIRAVSGGKSVVWRDLRDGLRFVLSWKALLMFSGICVVINMLGQAAASLMPILVTRHFQGDALQFGGLQMAIGVGSLLGGVILGIWGGFRRRMVSAMLALFLDGLAITVIGLSPKDAFTLALGMVFFVGILESLVLGLVGAIGQAVVPPEMQGRVFSLLSSVTQACAPLGLLLAGPTADSLGIQFWFLLTGIIFAAMGITALCVPPILKIEDRRWSTQSIAERITA